MNFGDNFNGGKNAVISQFRRGMRENCAFIAVFLRHFELKCRQQWNSEDFMTESIPTDDPTESSILPNLAYL